jgi:hypothetical protein
MFRIRDDADAGEGLPMSRRLCRIVLLALIASALASLAGCGLLAQKSDEAEELEAETPSAAPPSPHEIFASAARVPPSHPLSVLFPPPSPLAEQPPESKPPGDDVVWVSGYWKWDTRQDNWMWVGGVWVHAPAGQHWVAGYWSMATDGWRWVPGFWAKDDPPPPTTTVSPASPAPTFGPYTNSSNDPSLGFYAGYGYGMWWPWYTYRPLGDRPHGIERPPLLPSGHAASIPVTVHGPEAAKVLPALMPELASKIHEPPAASPHLDMASILASVPKSLSGEFLQHPELRPASGIGHAASLEHGGHIASLFSASHLATVLHETPSVHEAIASHPGGEHGGGSHGSGGHGGGGHGR